MILAEYDYNIYLKKEDLQLAISFKIRGAFVNIFGGLCDWI